MATSTAPGPSPDNAQPRPGRHTRTPLQTEQPHQQAGLPTPASSPIEATPPAGQAHGAQGPADSAVARAPPQAAPGRLDAETPSGNGGPRYRRAGNRQVGNPDSSTVTTPGTSPVAPLAPPPPPAAVPPKKLSFLSADASAAYLREMERRANAPPKVRRPAVKKTKKQIEAMRPVEFAEYMRAVWTAEVLAGKPEKEVFLKGKRIFYCDPDNSIASLATRRNLEYVRIFPRPVSRRPLTETLSQLARHGATIVPAYDPAQIDIIVTNTNKKICLQKLRLRTVRDLPPAIPVLRWEWVLATERKGAAAHWHEYATYADHVVFDPHVGEEERARVRAELEARKKGAGKAKPPKVQEGKVAGSDSAAPDESAIS